MVTMMMMMMMIIMMMAMIRITCADKFCPGSDNDDKYYDHGSDEDDYF